MDSINRKDGVLLFVKGIQKVLQPFVTDINSSYKHLNPGKIISSVYSAVNHNVYLFMTQMYLQHFPNPFQSKRAPAFHSESTHLFQRGFDC